MRCTKKAAQSYVEIELSRIFAAQSYSNVSQYIRRERGELVILCRELGKVESEIHVGNLDNSTLISMSMTLRSCELLKLGNIENCTALIAASAAR